MATDASSLKGIPIRQDILDEFFDVEWTAEDVYCDWNTGEDGWWDKYQEDFNENLRRLHSAGRFTELVNFIKQGR